MDRIQQISKLILSVAVLVLAVAALVFAMNYRTPEAQAIAGFKKPLPVKGQVFTQSSDGRTLYAWFYNTKKRSWQRIKYDQRRP